MSPEEVPPVSYVVIDHRHDEPAGVYRMVVGREVRAEVLVAAVDEEDEGTLEERVVGHSDVVDVVFSDVDERWDGLELDEIAALQREVVLDAIEQHGAAVEEAAAANAALPQMPGVGDALGA